MLIFNFHHVEPESRHEDRQTITITPDGLTRFIQTFRYLGFRFVSMKDVMDAGGPTGMGRKDVLITFDDGFENNFCYAAPVLEQEGCPATFFVLAGMFGGTNEWDQPHLPLHHRDPLMSLAQMKMLAKSPYITFGSHGMEHVHLPSLSEPQIYRQFYHSYKILLKELGEAFLPVFAYPWGEYSDPVIALMKKSPYRYAMTTRKNRWIPEDSPYAIPRYSAYDRDGNPLVIIAKLCRHRLLFG